MEEILSNYHKKAFQAENADKLGTASAQSRGSASSEKSLEQETVEELTAAGYEAYHVTASNYDALEDTLKTDFSSMGLDPNGSYIVVITGDNSNNNNARGYGDNLISPTPGPTEGGAYFTYTYQGVEYRMRYLTITAEDHPAYAKADHYDCLHSKSLDQIENCLNAVISVAADYISSPLHLGTIASICGLSLVDFGTVSNSTLSMYGGASWTRIYTQVWSEYDESWFFGSSVEYVQTYTFMTGMYYDSTTNRMESVPGDESRTTIYSEHYYDMTWRKEQAAKSYFHAITYDIVGSVKFKYNGRNVITLSENF